MRTPRWTTMAIGVALAVTALAGCSRGSLQTDADGKPSELRIGYQQIPNGDLIVKHEKWLDKDPGIDVRWIEFDSGADVAKAMQGRTIDIGLIGSAAASMTLTRQPYQVVWIHDLIGSAEALVARRATSLKGLEGKTVATPFGSTSHFALLAALDHAGIDDNKIDIVDLQPRQIADAWSARTIDAAYVWQPTLGSLQTQGGHTLLTSADVAKQGFPTSDLGVVSEELTQDFPKVVQAWVKAQQRANTMISEDHAEAVSIIADELDVDADQISEEMKGYRFPSAEEQAGGDLLGATDGLPRQLAETAAFLKDYPQATKVRKEQGALLPTPSAGDFADHVSSEFVKGAQ